MISGELGGSGFLSYLGTHLSQLYTDVQPIIIMLYGLQLFTVASFSVES